MSLEILFRPARPGDTNLFYSSYLRSFEASYFAELAGRIAYYRGQERLIRERLLPASAALVAHLPEDEDACVGWRMTGTSEAGGVLLHYVFVKPAFRRMHVAARLCAGMPTELVYTHRTQICSKLPIPKGWAFDMYPALEARP